MDDNRLLFDAFEIYYDRGIAALQKNEYTVARRNILAAAETLLKIAKASSGAVKAQRLKRATELYELANWRHYTVMGHINYPLRYFYQNDIYPNQIQNLYRSFLPSNYYKIEQYLYLIYNF